MGERIRHIIHILSKSAFTLGLIVLIPLAACNEELDDEVAVLSERVLLVGSDNVRLAGRILATKSLALDDHGFEISTDENFSNPVVITLGEATTNGGFLGEVTGLPANTDLYWRSYMIYNGETIFGDPKTVATKFASLNEFYPAIVQEADFVTIRGANFPTELEVFFGDQAAEILKQSDFEIRVRVPAPTTAFQVPLSVVTADQTLVFNNNFEYVIGSWINIGPYPEARKLKTSVAVVSDNEVAFGLGLIPNFWYADISGTGWSSLAYPDDTPRGAFSAGPYFGGGSTADPLFPGAFPEVSQRFWQFDNGALIELASTPFQIFDAGAVKSGDYIYVFGGTKVNVQPNEEVYRYSILNDTWEFVTDLPDIEISGKNPTFSNGSFIYIIDLSGRLWQLETNTTTWQIVGQHPEGAFDFGNAISVNGGAYVCFADGRRTLYFYDIASNTWTSKINPPLTRETRAYAIWENGDEIYFLLNSATQQNNGIDVWAFDPDDF